MLNLNTQLCYLLGTRFNCAQTACKMQARIGNTVGRVLDQVFLKTLCLLNSISRTQQVLFGIFNWCVRLKISGWVHGNNNVKLETPQSARAPTHTNTCTRTQTGSTHIHYMYLNIVRIKINRRSQLVPAVFCAVNDACRCCCCGFVVVNSLLKLLLGHTINTFIV